MALLVPAAAVVGWQAIRVGQPRPAPKAVAVAFLRQIGAYKGSYRWIMSDGPGGNHAVFQLLLDTRSDGPAPMIMVNKDEGIVVGYFARTDYDDLARVATSDATDTWGRRLGLPASWRRQTTSEGFRLRGGVPKAVSLVEFPFGYEPFEQRNGVRFTVDPQGQLLSYSRAVGYRALPPPDKLLSVADGLRIAAKRTDPKAEVRFHKTMYVVPNDLFGGHRRKDPKELVLARVYRLSDRHYLFLDAADGKSLGGFEVAPSRRPPRP